MLLRNFILFGLFGLLALRADPTDETQEYSLYKDHLKLSLPSSFKTSDAGKFDDYRFRDESRNVMIMIDHKATALKNDDVPKSIDTVATHFQKTFAGSTITTKEAIEFDRRQFGYFALAMQVENKPMTFSAIYFSFDNRLLLIGAMGPEGQKNDITSMIRELPGTVKVTE